MIKAIKSSNRKLLMTVAGAVAAVAVLSSVGTAMVLGQGADVPDVADEVETAVVVSGTGQNAPCDNTAVFTDNANLEPPVGGVIAATVTLRKNCAGIIIGSFSAEVDIDGPDGDLRVSAIVQSCTNIGSTPCSAGALPQTARPGRTRFQDNNDDDEGESNAYTFFVPAGLAPGNYVINIFAEPVDGTGGGDDLRDRVLIVQTYGIQIP